MSKTTTSSSWTPEDEIRPVTDELTAMRGKLLDGYDEIKSYAIGLVQMESIVSIMARRQFHAFFLLDALGLKHLIEKNADPAVRALAILVIAADIAISLLPAVARIDAKIKAESASSLEGLVGQRIDRHRVFERRLLAAYDLSDAEKTAYPPRLWPRQAIDPELDS